MSSPFPLTILPYIPIHHLIPNVVEPILPTVLVRKPMLRVELPPSCQPWQEKLRKSENDCAHPQPLVNQERLKKCSIGNLNRFNQNRFRLKRLIPVEHDLSLTCQAITLNRIVRNVQGQWSPSTQRTTHASRLQAAFAFSHRSQCDFVMCFVTALIERMRKLIGGQFISQNKNTSRRFCQDLHSSAQPNLPSMTWEMCFCGFS